MTMWSASLTFEADTEEEALHTVGLWHVTPGVTLLSVTANMIVVPRPIEVRADVVTGPTTRQAPGLIELGPSIAYVLENPEWPDLPPPPSPLDEVTPAPGGPTEFPGPPNGGADGETNRD